MDINALKQAAIDAYMRQEGYSKEADGYLDYGFGFIANVNFDGTGTATYSTGGPVGSSSDLDYTQEWASVRSRVDTALEDWQENRLPSPGALNGGVEKAKEAITALNIGDTSAAAGALGGYYKTISDNAQHFRGAAMDAFNNSFVNQLPAVINNHGCLAAIVAEAWSAEKEIWTKARTDRDTLVEKTTTALKNYAESAGANDIKFILALTGAALAGAGAIATGGAALPFALATAGVTALSATNDYVGELKVERNGANYDELMKAFEDGLNDIDEGITKQETLVQEGLENGWKVFEENRSLFDLTPRVSDDGDGNWSNETSLFNVQDAGGLEIVLPGQAVINSLVSGLTNLANGLEVAEPKITTGAEDGGLLAPSAREVGLQYNSASIWMWIVGDNNSSSVRDLKWDLDNGTRMLQAIIKDFRDRDAASQSALDQLRGQVAAGSGEDPWG